MFVLIRFFRGLLLYQYYNTTSHYGSCNRLVCQSMVYNTVQDRNFEHNRVVFVFSGTKRKEYDRVLIIVCNRFEFFSGTIGEIGTFALCRQLAQKQQVFYFIFIIILFFAICVVVHNKTTDNVNKLLPLINKYLFLSRI